MNPWEVCALEHAHSTTTVDGRVRTLESRLGSWTRTQTSTFDSIIYPGLYSASGFNVMGVLLQVIARSNPQIDLGPVDASCPLVICDLKQQDSPIVYASDAFCGMTGYSTSEVMGKNCRFMQAPGGRVRARSKRQFVDRDVVGRMRKAIKGNNELQLEVVNFKKDGQQFINILAIVPVCYQDREFNYSIGFMCEKDI